MTSTEIVETFTRGERGFDRRWLSAKQIAWLLGQWRREGGAEPSSYWSLYTGSIAGELADGALWTLTVYNQGGRGYLDVSPSKAQRDAAVAAAQADAEPFF